MKNKYVDGIKKSMYKTPSDYKDFKQYYSETLQDKIDDVYEMASNTTEIEVENTKGSMIFEPLVCRVNHAIEPKTGLNLGDDFKDLKFFDVNSPYGMGQLYKFNNSIWIAVNTDNYRYITKSSIVRRCNNELRWIDIESGLLISEPCIVDYAVKYANLYYNNTVNIPQGTLSLIVQYNNRTNKIRINDRFVLGSYVYKIKTVADALRSETYNTNSVPLITFEIALDTTAADDNFTIGSEQYNPLYPENLANTDKYADMANPNEVGSKNVAILPDVNTIYIEQEQEFSCYIMANNQQQDIGFDFEFSGIDDKYYRYSIIDDNHFSVFNAKPNINNKLKVLCKAQDGSCQKELYLKMGGAF